MSPSELDLSLQSMHSCGQRSSTCLWREGAGGADMGSNAEFIDQMIADPVFSEMLHDPEPSNEGPSAITQSSDNDVNDNHTSSTSDPSHSHSHAHSDPSHSHSHSHSSAPSSSASPDGPGSRHAAQDKVRSTLRSFVRDWSAEGAPERDACYARCLAALQQHWAHKIVGKPGRRAKGDWRVLVPGCGLGRLAMEIAALGASSFADMEIVLRPFRGCGILVHWKGKKR